MTQTETHYDWPWLSGYEPHPELAGARPVIAEHGMVSSPHHQASLIGLDVLRSGGNAVDAAVATSAALMVTLPMQCSPGGDAMWLIRQPDGTTGALDASGRSSFEASADKLRSKGLTSIGHRSPDSVTVPGAVDGWVQSINRFGSRSLSEVLEPAAKLAESGCFVSRHMHASFRSALPVLKNWGSISLWSATGEAPKLYDRLTQPLLAKTLRTIGQTHGEDFYRGAIARSIVKGITDAGGPLSLQDLEAHRSEWVEPLSGRYRNGTIFTSPPATQGFALLQALAVIDRLLPESADVSRLSMLHLLIETVAEALEERDLVVCDRARMTVDVRSIFGKKRVDEIVATIKSDNVKYRKPSTASTKGRGDTAHLSVVDGNGLCVSLIQSLYFDFGSGIAVENGGFTLQNRGAAFSLEDGAPNELLPHTRPPHTLTPTIVALDGGATYVLGCMGGDGQIQTQVQLITNMIDGELDPQQAISKPRWYLDRANPDGPTLLVESGVDENILVGLKETGHKVTVIGPSEEIMGHAQVIARLPGGVLVGGSDPRSDGQVYGW